MKGILGLLFLSTLAVALALLVGGNHATVTVFWYPHRLDMSFNLALFGVMAVFVLLYLAVRAWVNLRRLPQQAHRWRQQQLERGIHLSLLDALAYLFSGRFVRAKGAAEQALKQLQGVDPTGIPQQAQITVLAHVLAAEGAQALGDTEVRDQHLSCAVDSEAARQAGQAREGALLSAARWAVEGRDASTAATWLAALPQGAARRIQALRLRLQVAKLQNNTRQSLDMVRTLAKHRAYTPAVAASLLRGLVQDALRTTYDSNQLLSVWQALSLSERRTPELILALIERWQDVRQTGDDDHDLVREVAQCLPAAWEAYATLSPDNRYRLVSNVEVCLPDLDNGWLALIERQQQSHLADPALQYLAGQAYMQRQLWGKAAHLLRQASHAALPPRLARNTWCSLAQLAEERGDLSAAQQAWKTAAQIR